MSDSLPPAPADDELAASEMSFGEHLDELRRRLWRAVLASLVGLVVVFVWHEEVFAFVTEPYRQVADRLRMSPQLNQFGVQEVFFAHVKVAFIVGLIATAPFWIYQLWAFVAAGLYAKERKVIYRLVPLCVLLFLAGVSFGYYALIPLGIEYLVSFGDAQVTTPTIGVRQYLGLFTVLTLVLGVAFQLPVFMIGLARTGVVALSTFRTKRKFMILGIFVLAAIVTPPDPFTQIMMAGPLLLLYEMGLLLAWVSLGKDRPPVVWKAHWPFLKRVLIVAGLLFVFWDPLMGIFRGAQANRLVLDHEDAALGAVERFFEGRAAEVFEVTAAFPDPVRAAGEEKAEIRFLVARVEGRSHVLRIARTRRNELVVDRAPDDAAGPRVVVAHFTEGLHIQDVQLPKEVRLGRVLDLLLVGHRDGGEETVRVTGAMLEDLTGIAPGEDAEAYAEKVRAWWRARGAAPFRQEPPELGEK